MRSCSLKKAAENAVWNCMGVTEEDRVLIVTDIASQEVGLALKKAALEKTVHTTYRVLETVAKSEGMERPLPKIPRKLVDLVEGEITVTFLAVSSVGNEGDTFRGPFINLAKRNARHAHMPGVTKKIMEIGMWMDYKVVDKLTRNLFEKINKKVVEARVTTPAGTEFVAKFNPNAHRWCPCGGLYYTRGEWGNLPDGEVFTTVKDLNGTLVVDGCIGESIGETYYKRGYDYQKNPLKIDVKNGIIEHIGCSNSKMLNDFKKYVSQVPCAKRAGEFGLGTNIFLESFSGNDLLDEKFPAVHIAFGDPFPEETGARWKCEEAHIDCVMRECSVWLTDIKGKEVQIMKKGKYKEDLFK